MKRILIIGIVVILALSGCNKNNSPIYSGTMTINNQAADQNFNVYGFQVPTGKKVLNLSNQEDVIIIQPDFDINYNIKQIYYSTNNFYNSFFRVGNYNDVSAALQAFNKLTSFINKRELGSIFINLPLIKN